MFVAMTVAPGSTVAAIAAEQRAFDAPEAAFEAMIDDLRSDDVKDLLAIFGPAADPVLNSGDAVAEMRSPTRTRASALSRSIRQSTASINPTTRLRC